MVVQFTPYAIPVFTAVLLLVVVAIVGWRRKSHPAGLPLAAVGAGGVLYASGYLVELTATSLSVKYVMWLVQSAGWNVVAPSLLVFVISYTDNPRLLTRPVLAAVFSVPAISIALLVSPWRYLILTDAYLVTVDGILHLDVTHGPWFMLTVLYSYIVVITSFLLVFRLIVSTTGSHRMQASAVAIGIGFPLVVELFRALFPDVAAILVAPQVDTLPLALAVTGIAFALGAFRHDLLTSAPISTEMLIESTQNGVVVMTPDLQVLRVNSTARTLLDVRASPNRQHLAELSERASRVAEALDTTESPSEMPLGDDGRTIEIRHSSLTDRRGNTVGELLILVDITERAKYERELEQYNQQVLLLNQILRHDIRNDAAVAVGWGDLLREELIERELPPETIDELDRIIDANEHIVELTNIASNVTKTFASDEGESMKRVEIQSTIEHEVEKARSTHPEASIELSTPSSDVYVEANDLLGSVFGNIIRNAIVHNDIDSPHVEVDVERVDEEVHVSIADNGPGIDPAIRDRLFDQGEKGERSPGMGLGLYLVKTLVDDFGGEVVVEDNEPRGSVFEVRLPILDG